MFKADQFWITIAETKGFSSEATEVFTVNERETLTDLLAVRPDIGDLIEGGGGVRVISWPAQSQPVGQVDVVYLFRDLNMPVFMLGIYASDDPLDLSQRERQKIAELVAEIVETYGLQKVAAFVGSNGVA